MTGDVLETNNLAGKYPELVSELSGLHDKWAKEMGITERPKRKRTNKSKRANS